MVTGVAFHPDGTCVASCSADNTIKLWDVRTNQLLQHYPAHADTVNSISFHPTGNFLLSSSNDATLKVPSWGFVFSCRWLVASEQWLLGDGDG